MLVRREEPADVATVRAVVTAAFARPDLPAADVPVADVPVADVPVADVPVPLDE
jgi:hypothetical protein